MVDWHLQCLPISTNSELQVKFVSPLGQEGWALRVNLASTTGFTSSGGTSFGLGNRSWTISDDATKCNVQVKV